MDKRRAIQKYFARMPKWALWLAGFAVLTGLAADGGIRYGAFLAAIALVGWAITFVTGRPSDEQVDRWLAEDLTCLESRALVKCGLDRESLVRDAVVIIGPRLNNTGGAKFGFRKGKDMKARFTPVDVSVLNFTEHQLISYQCGLDSMTGDPRSESTGEYFYNDIVSVSTEVRPQTFRFGELDKELLARAKDLGKSTKKSGELQVNDAQIFKLTNSGGTSLQVVLDAPMVINSLGGGTISTERAEQAVQAVRKMVREKKAGALPIRSALA